MFHFISFDLISFQGTNLSEGRGTTLPFQLVSATALLSEAPACVPAFLPTWLAALLIPFLLNVGLLASLPASLPDHLSL